jgi:hypothetical protein
MLEIIRDGNKFLPDGSPNPNHGNVTTIEHADHPTVDRVLSKTEFADHCYAQFGGGLTGVARFGAILKAAAASTSDAVYATLDRYLVAPSIEKPNAQIFIGILASEGIMTPTEVTAVSDNWPTA